MNRSNKFRLVALVLPVLALTGAHHAKMTEMIMAETAVRFVSSLSAKQETTGVFDFDSKHRVNWHYFPDNGYKDVHGSPRPGVNYKSMSAVQRRLADALLGASLSQSGFAKAMSVISLEEILRVIENDTKGHRDLEKYYFAVFGKPSPNGTWGLRVEGHHLSLNFTIKKGKLISSSPTFLGANPHNVPSGPYRGLRALAKEEDLARGLVRSLNSSQIKQALVSEDAYADILTKADTRAKLEGQPSGLPASQMNEEQWQMLVALVYEYIHNMPADVAARRLQKFSNVRREKLFFAWAGSLEAGKGDYYRVQGPSFLIEYDNTQNDNNHSHSVWRDFRGDFGLDVLALHYQEDNHGLTTREYAAD